MKSTIKAPTIVLIGIDKKPKPKIKIRVYAKGIAIRIVLMKLNTNAGVPVPIPCIALPISNVIATKGNVNTSILIYAAAISIKF